MTTPPETPPPWSLMRADRQPDPAGDQRFALDIAVTFALSHPDRLIFWVADSDSEVRPLLDAIVAYDLPSVERVTLAKGLEEARFVNRSRVRVAVLGKSRGYSADLLVCSELFLVSQNILLS